MRQYLGHKIQWIVVIVFVVLTVVMKIFFFKFAASSSLSGPQFYPVDNIYWDRLMIDATDSFGSFRNFFITDLFWAASLFGFIFILVRKGSDRDSFFLVFLIILAVIAYTLDCVENYTYLKDPVLINARFLAIIRSLKEVFYGLTFLFAVLKLTKRI